MDGGGGRGGDVGGDNGGGENMQPLSSRLVWQGGVEFGIVANDSSLESSLRVKQYPYLSCH